MKLWLVAKPQRAGGVVEKDGFDGGCGGQRHGVGRKRWLALVPSNAIGEQRRGRRLLWRISLGRSQQMFGQRKINRVHQTS